MKIVVLKTDNAYLQKKNGEQIHCFKINDEYVFLPYEKSDDVMYHVHDKKFDFYSTIPGNKLSTKNKHVNEIVEISDEDF